MQQIHQCQGFSRTCCCHCPGASGKGALYGAAHGQNKDAVRATKLLRSVGRCGAAIAELVKLVHPMSSIYIVGPIIGVYIRNQLPSLSVRYSLNRASSPPAASVLWKRCSSVTIAPASAIRPSSVTSPVSMLNFA